MYTEAYWNGIKITVWVPLDQELVNNWLWKEGTLASNQVWAQIEGDGPYRPVTLVNPSCLKPTN